MKEAIENINIEKLQEKVDAFRLYLASLKKEEDYNIEIIKNKLKEIFALSEYRKEYRTHYFVTDGLFRARKHEKWEDLFLWTKDFWFRDWTKVPPENWRYDRCNKKGENVWYFSNSLKACIAEVRPVNGDIITVANIKQFTDRFFSRFLHVGSAHLRENDEGLDKIYATEERYKDISDSVIKKMECVDKFLDEIFLMNVIDNERFKYLGSISLVEMFKKCKSGYFTDGIIYPSIALNMDAINVAFLNPGIDEFNFYLYQAIQFKVLKAELDKYYEVEPVWIGKNFQENQYGNFPIYWKKPRQEEIDAYSFSIEINPN